MRQLSLFFLALLLSSSLFAQTFGPTQNCDDLWLIAYHLRPSSSVTTSQVMLAIFNKNPDAFYANNLNGLKPDVKLTMPTLSEIENSSPAEAEQIIKKQKKEWPALRKEYLAKHLMPNIHCGINHVQRMTTRFEGEVQKETDSSKEIIALQDEIKQLQQQVADSQQRYQQLLMIYQNLLNNFELTKNNFQVATQAASSTNSFLKAQLEAFQSQAEEMSASKLSGVLMQFRDNAFSHVIPQPSMIITPTNNNQQEEADMHFTTEGVSLFSVSPILFIGALILILLLLLFVFLLSSKPKKPAPQKNSQLQEKESRDEIFKPNEEMSVVQEKIVQPNKEKKDFFTKTVKEYQYLSGEDVETSKLDLSKAYIEMGSYEHAREVLQSVIEEGNAEQKAEAEKLLKSVESK